MASGPERFYPPTRFDGVAAADNMRETTERALAGDQVLCERTVHNAQGRELCCELRLARLPSIDRRLIRGNLVDITERKAAEAKIKRLNNLYAALSQCNQAIVRCTGQDELFQEICRDVVQYGGIIGAEALLRWHHPEFGMVSPAEFIPIAEDGGQILSIGEWVLRSAVRQRKHWSDGARAPMTLAVNLSAVQFHHPRLVGFVMQILDDEKLAPQLLELELTEGVAMDIPLAAIAVMDSLDARGIGMSIDDFGTGYSSLSYLKRFKITKLKIDQSFVRDIADDPNDKVIVGAVISLANSLGLKTIAEGVETEEQLAFLREKGCDEAQGYYFSRPLPADQFEAFLKGRCRES